MNHVNIRLLGAKVLYIKFLSAQLVHLLVWNAQLGVQMFFAGAYEEVEGVARAAPPRLRDLTEGTWPTSSR